MNLLQRALLRLGQLKLLTRMVIGMLLLFVGLKTASLGYRIGILAVVPVFVLRHVVHPRILMNHFSRQGVAFFCCFMGTFIILKVISRQVDALKRKVDNKIQKAIAIHWLVNNSKGPTW